MPAERHLLPPHPPSKTFLKAQWISQVKRDYFNNHIAPMPSVDVAVEDRPEYHRLLERLHLQSNDADQKLQMMFSIVQREDVMRELIGLNCIIQTQRSLINTDSNPRYIVALQTLKKISVELQRILDLFVAMLNAFKEAIDRAKEQRGEPPVMTQEEMQQQQQLLRQQLQTAPSTSTLAAAQSYGHAHLLGGVNQYGDGDNNKNTRVAGK